VTAREVIEKRWNDCYKDRVMPKASHAARNADKVCTRDIDLLNFIH
jgi:hypothetical protein